MDAPGVARDQSKDVFVFESLEALFRHLTQEFEDK